MTIDFEVARLQSSFRWAKETNYADDVRRYCKDNIIDAARQRGENLFRKPETRYPGLAAVRLLLAHKRLVKKVQMQGVRSSED